MATFFIGEQLRNEFRANFDLRRLERGRKPIEMGQYHVEHVAGLAVNNLLVKLKGTLVPTFPDNLPASLKALVNACIAHAQDSGLGIRGRYAYLTYDTRPVKAKHTQRRPGWHFDGLQGDEVPVKVPGCLNFLWSNTLPCKYSEQGFDLSGLNVSQHNIFDSLAEQVFEESISEAKAGELYLMSCYQMHCAQEADRDIDDRVFVRLTFSELPYTSVKMTLNPKIVYPFVPHTTSGCIPTHLKNQEASPTTKAAQQTLNHDGPFQAINDRKCLG